MYKIGSQVTFFVYGLCLLVNGLRAECPEGCKCIGDKIECPSRVLQALPRHSPLLNLVGCDLKRLEESSFTDIGNVHQLCLTQNQLSHIDSEMFKPLTNLNKLDLSNNQISTIDKHAFHSLTQLQGLILFNNRLSSVREIFKKNTRLTFLNLASNQITEIAEKDFENLSQLRYLDLSANFITVINSKAFEPLHNLRYLIVQSNRISSFSFLSSSLRSLRVADFTNNRLERIPKELPARITDLRFGKNNITKIGKSDLKHISALQLLTLNNNQISSIHENAFNNLNNVKEIWLDSNELTTMPTKLPLNLVKLAINSNLISRIHAHTFVKNPYIRELTLETNKITDIEPEAFSKLTSLQHLNLQSNQLHTLKTGIFKDLTSLLSLRMANNPIATIEKRSFESLKSLQLLDISYGELEHATIQMDIFKELPRLQEFNLMNSAGLCKSLLDQLRNGEVELTESLQTIDFRYNDLKNMPETIQNIFPRLTSFLLSNNAWYCDSDLLWLKRWVETSDITFYSIKKPACCKPSHLKGKPLEDVAESEFLRSPAYVQSYSFYGHNKPRSYSLETQDQLQIKGSPKVAVVDNSRQNLIVERKKRRRERRKNRRNKRKSLRRQRASKNKQ